MTVPACSDQEFINMFRSGKSLSEISSLIGVATREVVRRRNRMEKRYDQPVRTVGSLVIKDHAGKIDLGIENGTVVVFSDAHFWPGFKTTANRALITMIKQLKPTAVVCNGDAFDGSQISRFPRPFFDDDKPTVKQELDVCVERLSEIVAAAGPGCNKIWTLGNHDLRFEARLAANNSEYQGIRGFHLKDHFPEWKPAWSFWLNDAVEIRHRYKGGVHATTANVMANHHSTITGHLHALQVRPYTDGRGNIKYGVDTGCLADTNGPQFSDYLEGRQPNWRSGFVLLTFKNGQLLMPEIVQKLDEDHFEFRGHVLHADTGEIT